MIEIVEAVVVLETAAERPETDRISIGDIRTLTQTAEDERTKTVFKESVARRGSRRDGVARLVGINDKSEVVAIAAVAGESNVDDTAVRSAIAGDTDTFARCADSIVINIVINDFRIDDATRLRRSEISEI